MNLTISDLQKQIQRGPALVIGPGMTTSGGRDAELLRILRQAFPNLEGGDRYGTYLDYADAVIATSIAPEAQVRKAIETFFENPLSRHPQLGVMVKANWTAVIALCSDTFFGKNCETLSTRRPRNGRSRPSPPRPTVFD